MNDHVIGTGRAYLFDGPYRMKVFPTNHLESLGPETLFVSLSLRHVQVTEAINDFDVRRFQGCKFFLVKIAVCGAPSFDEFTSRWYTALLGQDSLLRVRSGLPIFWVVLHSCLFHQACFPLVPKKGNSHTLFGRVAFLSPRGHSTTRRELGHTNSLAGSPGKRASVYEYRVHSPVSANRKLLLSGTGTNCRLFVEVDRISVGTRLYTKCARIERFQ